MIITFHNKINLNFETDRFHDNQVITIMTIAMFLIMMMMTMTMTMTMTIMTIMMTTMTMTMTIVTMMKAHVPFALSRHQASSEESSQREGGRAPLGFARYKQTA